VLVDTGTVDDTAEVALRAGARVVHAAWPGHVAQKNRALAEAVRGWVLSLDADEWLTPEAWEQVRSAIATPAGAVGFSLPRCNHWLGTPLRHGRWYPDRKVRVVRRGAGRWVGDDPHDQLQVDGLVRPLPGDIAHVPYRSLGEHLRTIDRYTEIAARSLGDRGVRARLWDPPAHAALHWIDAVLFRSAWRDGVPGMAVATLGAAYSGLKWWRLWRRAGR